MDNFTSPVLIYNIFYLSIVLASIANITLNNNSSGCMHLVPFFSGNASGISPLNVVLTFGVR